MSEMDLSKTITPIERVRCALAMADAGYDSDVFLDEAADLLWEYDRRGDALNILMTAGNHLATYKTDKWPDYKLLGTTRDKQCEAALEALGAGREYDMWCCWSAMMQIRDDHNL